MSQSRVNPLSAQDLKAQLPLCMIRDRFRFGKELGSKRNREKLSRRITKSVQLAERRRDTVPPVDYPEELPITARVADIRAAIASHQVVIVAGETGSGKTTQIPKICLDMGRGILGTIGHTQPRRVAARTVAQRIADELGVKLGSQVGYQMRFTDHTGPETHIKLMTDGILLAETQDDRFLEQYDTIIIDEAHERSLNIDFLLGYIKRILPKRPDLKVIVTSATIDVQRFSSHFGNAPIIEVSGRTYPVDVLYRPLERSKSEDADEQIYGGILDVLGEIHRRRERGDTLVFLPGEREIRELSTAIRRSGLADLEVLPLYSRLSVAEQNRIFAPHDRQRVVLATNVAETSLTVPGIRYVIDPGMARISRYSYRSKVQQLPVEPISQASAEQRKGRCGRVSAGVCYRLYSEDDFASRPEFTQPEIMRTNLASVILQMLVLRLGDIAKFPFVERPDQRQINDGFQLLFELGAVGRNRSITRLGKDMSRFPVDLRFARMLLAAARTGCLAELLVITSALSVQDPRDRPHEHQQAADQAHREFWHEESDFLTLVNLWQRYETERQERTQSQLRKYCRDHFLSFIRMREWRDIHRQLTLICREAGLKVNQAPGDDASVHRAILAGLLGNIGQKTGENEYAGARNRTHYIFPGSAVFKRKPKWIVSGELVETTRLYGRNVAAIDSAWVEPLAPDLVNRNYSEPTFEREQGQVIALEEVSLYGLPVVTGRRVSFGALDPVKAREIFIQSALVEQQLKWNPGFLQQNKRLIDEVERLESKSRKRDILVDAHVLYEFYDQRLPANICSELDLRSFVNESKQNSRQLFLDREQLMQQKVEISENLYPDAIKVASADLKLNYTFDPRQEDDGVSVDVPVAMLREVSRAQLDWVIPGLLREKCLALIRSLPKALRRHFVPAPDYADRVIEGLEFDGRELTEVLAERLFRLTGNRVTAADFKVGNLDRHLNMNVRVIDEAGRVLGGGRDVDVLRAQFSEVVSKSFARRKPHDVEREGLTDWTFGELPRQVEFSHANMRVKGYPAVVDQGDTVAIQIVDNQLTARRLSDQGLLRLIRLQLRDQEKYVRGHIPGFKGFALYYATRGRAEPLLNDIVDAVFRYTFVEDQVPVTSEAAFRERLQGKGGLMSVANEVADLLQTTLKSMNEVEQRLAADETDLNGASMADIRGQLDGLLGPGFLKDLPFAWLRQYPRFLRAIEYRLEKLKGNLGRDRQATDELAGYIERMSHINNDDVEAAQHYRWMVEEYRVSLFAQPVGTSLPVSPKRLEAQWDRVQRRQAEL
jgi:ATP-dependent helicase HrpA